MPRYAPSLTPVLHIHTRARAFLTDFAAAVPSFRSVHIRPSVRSRNSALLAPCPLWHVRSTETDRHLKTDTVRPC